MKPPSMFYDTKEVWSWWKQYVVDRKPAADVIRAWFSGPSAPINFAIATSGFNVSVRWDPTPGATSYQLEAGTATSLSNLFLGDVGHVTALSAAGPAGTFFARVRSKTGNALSRPSNEVQFTLGCVPPSAPSPLAFSKAGALLTLTWAALPNAIYRLSAGTAPGLNNVLDVDIGTAPGLQANISGVPAGTYYLRVAARNACGLSTPSNEVAIPVP